MAVITIAREMGSEGDKLGLELAEALGYEFLDKEIIRKVAAEIGSSPEEVELYDEKADSWLVRFLTQVFVAHPDVAAYYSTFANVEPTYAYGVTEPAIFYETPKGAAKPVDPGTIVKHFEEIIRQVAAKGDVVIVGRGSQVVLRDLPHTLHLRTVAPFDWRVDNVIRDNPDLSNSEAADLVARNDRWRARYVSVNYNQAWNDPLLYHAVISVDKWDWGRLVGALSSCVQASGA